MRPRTPGKISTSSGASGTILVAVLLSLSCSESSPAPQDVAPACDERLCDCERGWCDWPGELVDLRLPGATLSPKFRSSSYENEYFAEVDEEAVLVVEVANPKYVHVTVGGKSVVPGQPFRLELEELAHSFTHRVIVEAKSVRGFSTQYFLNLTLRPRVLTIPFDEHGFFRTSLAISANGRRLFVGTSLAADGGSIQVYEWEDEWMLKTSITAPPDAGLDFGAQLAVTADGNLLLASAPYEGINYEEMNPYAPLTLATGAVYVIEQVEGRWDVTQRIDRAPGIVGYTFGMAIAVADSGKRLAIGAPGLKANLEPIRIYERSVAGQAFQLTKELYAHSRPVDSASDEGWFGSSLTFAAQGDLLFSCPIEAQSLLMHEYTTTGWRTLSLRVRDSEFDMVRGLGTPAVTADGSRIAVSAAMGGLDSFYHDVIIPFFHDESGWHQEAYLPCSINAHFGCEAAIGAAGNLLLERDRALLGGFGPMLVYRGEKHETSGIWINAGSYPLTYGKLAISSNAEVMAVASAGSSGSPTVPVYVFGTPAMP